MIFLGYLLAFVMGSLLGVLGGGGSILTVPIFSYLFNMPSSIATGNSLFVVGVTALVASVSYIKNNLVNLRTASLFVIPSILGVSVARQILLPSLPSVISVGSIGSVSKDNLIMILFAFLMIAASFSMLRPRASFVGDKKSSWVQIVILAFVASLILGTLGAGGGFLLVPILTIAVGLPTRIAVGTSLVIISIQSISGFLSDPLLVSTDWFFLIGFTAITVLGAVLGIRIGSRIDEKNLRRGFGFFILILGSIIITEKLFRG